MDITDMLLANINPGSICNFGFVVNVRIICQIWN